MAKGDGKVIEHKVEFNSESDKSIFAVVHPESSETMAEITGYGLDVKYNMSLINSQSDIDAVTEGIAAVFKEHLMSKILK